jgi:hypothetical protein
MPSTTYSHTHAIGPSRTLLTRSLDTRAHTLNAHAGRLALRQRALQHACTPSTHVRIDSYHFSDGTVGSSTLEYAGIDTRLGSRQQVGVSTYHLLAIPRLRSPPLRRVTC